MSTTPNRQLDKTLKVNNKTYEVTAVYSDEAGKVTNPLTVTKQETFSTTAPAFAGNASTYDGSVERSLNIVPAEGGAFTGPVLFKRLQELQELIQELGLSEEDAQYLAVNRADITKLLSDISGCPCYTWNGTLLIPITYVKPGTGEQSETPVTPNTSTENKNDEIVFAQANIVFGTEAVLSDLVTADVCPQVFIYVCTDNGNLFIGGPSLGLGAEKGYIQLAHHALTADEAEEANHAAEADEALLAGNAYYLVDNGVTDPTASNSFSYESLCDALNGLADDIEDITKADGTLADAISTHNNDTNAHAYILKCIRRLLFGDDASAKTASIPNPDSTGPSGTSFPAYNSTRLNGLDASHYQGKIFISSTADDRDAQIATLRGPGGAQNGDIWIQIG